MPEVEHQELRDNQQRTAIRLVMTCSVGDTYPNWVTGLGPGLIANR